MYLLVSIALAGIPVIDNPAQVNWHEVELGAAETCAPLKTHGDLALAIYQRGLVAEALIEKLERNAFDDLPRLDGQLMRLYPELEVAGDLEETELVIARARAAYLDRARYLSGEVRRLYPEFLDLYDSRRRSYSNDELPKAIEQCVEHIVHSVRYIVDIALVAEEQSALVDASVRSLITRRPVDIPDDTVVPIPTFEAVPDGPGVTAPPVKYEPRVPKFGPIQ